MHTNSHKRRPALVITASHMLKSYLYARRAGWSPSSSWLFTPNSALYAPSQYFPQVTAAQLPLEPARLFVRELLCARRSASVSGESALRQVGWRPTEMAIAGRGHLPRRVLKCQLLPIARPGLLHVNQSGLLLCQA